MRTTGKDDILALGYAFAGLVYQTESDRQWLKLSPLAQQKAAQLKTVDALNSAIDKLLEMQTVEQARQVLEKIGRQPRS